MPRINLTLESPASGSPRAEQLAGMFDVPSTASTSVTIKGNLPLAKRAWNVGLIVGPSGAGKSSVARELWGKAVSPRMKWTGASVIDDFDADRPIQEITDVCQAVGFNTVPAWLRPYKVLSTGERFRVEIARRLLELPDPIIVDEFTSVVDRQVAKITAHAVQKWVRRHDRQFVAVTCHHDVLDWLQPDWTFEPATGEFAWRSLQPRPQLDGSVARVRHSFWRLFAPYHYLTATLHRSAACFALFIADQPVSFIGVLHRPHPKTKNIKGITRAVTLPDWQGLGLTFHLARAVAGAYRALGYRVHHYPAHPAFIRAMDRSPDWALWRRPQQHLAVKGGRKPARLAGRWRSNEDWRSSKHKSPGLRPCATFRYAGPALERDVAVRLLGVGGDGEKEGRKDGGKERK